jgi:hypothetical protein
MRPVRNVFQKLSRTEQRREGVVAYLCMLLCYIYLFYCILCFHLAQGKLSSLRQSHSYPKTKNLEDTTTAARNMNICFEFSIHPSVPSLPLYITPSPSRACSVSPLYIPQPCTPSLPLYALWSLHSTLYSLHPCTYLGLVFAHACNVQCTELSPLFNTSHTSNPLHPVSIPQPSHPPIHISAHS